MDEAIPALMRLALLARGRPGLLAGLLWTYQESEGLDAAGLAAFLRCEPEALPRLALCRRPRPAPHFRQDIERIADYTGASPVQLMKLIRAAEAREALRTAPDTPSSMLLAARDHDRPDSGPCNDEDSEDGG